MNIFYKRPLSLILCILLGGFSLFSVLPDDFSALAFPIFLIVALLIARRCVGRTARTLAVLALCISLALAMIFPYVFRVQERYTDTVEIEAVVIEIGTSKIYESVLDIKTKSIDGDNLGSYKLKATVSPESAKNLTRGSVISFRARLLSFENSDSFDADSYYTSRGFSARAEIAGDIEVTGSVSLPDFAYLRELIARKTILQSGEESASLFIALFTGERDLLSEDLRLAFTRIGINHVLALSGMHLAILSALLERLLRAIGIGKKTRLFTLALTVLGYMALTGFSSSVTRAGIMLIITSATFLFASSRDSFTSLCVAVAVILLFEPYAARDIGLWLSALATLGVLEAGNLGRRKTQRWCYRPEPRRKRMMRTLLSGGGITLFAMSATLAISATTFSGISPLSIITTPIFSFLAEIYIYTGLTALAIGRIIPIGKLLPYMYTVTDWLSDNLSSWRISYYSTDFPAVRILAAVSAIAFFGFMVIRLKRRLVGALVSIALLIATLTTAGIMTREARLTDSVIYHAGESSECLLLRSSGELGLIDFSSGATRSKYTLLSALEEAKAVEVDYIAFAYYTSNLPYKAADATSAVLTDTVYIPYPKNDDERDIADKVKSTLADGRAELRYYNAGFLVRESGVRISVLYRSEYGDGAPRCAILAEIKGERILYLSSGVFEDKSGYNIAYGALSSAEHIIFGSSGKSYKDGFVFSSSYERIKTLIISGDEVTLTQSARIFYDERGTGFYLRPKSVNLLP